MSEITINAAEILHDATAVGASDIFIVAGLSLIHISYVFPVTGESRQDLLVFNPETPK